MNLADIGRLILPPREEENIPNPDGPPMQIEPLDLSRPGNMPPGSHYPNPDARTNPQSAPEQGLIDFSNRIQPKNLDVEDHGDNIGVSKMPPPPRFGADTAQAPQPPDRSSDPMQDPGFRSFVADRARQLEELRAAQGQAEDSRNSFGMRAGNALITLGMVGGGHGDPSGMINERMKQAGQPVADVLQRQKASEDLTGAAAKEVGLSGEMLKSRQAGEEADPASQRSMAIARLLKLRPDLAKGFTANMAPVAEKQGQLDVENKKAATEDFKAHQPEMEVNSVTGQFYNRKDANTPSSPEGRPLRPQDAAKLDAILNGAEAVDRVKAARREGVLPGVGEYSATLNGEAPALAAADSGTGRASGQNDIIKRAPNLYSVAGDKTFDSDRQRYLQAARDRISALKQAGYNVSEQEAHLARLSQGGASHTHYLVSPDRKTRIPADATGKPLGPAEPNPNG